MPLALMTLSSSQRCSTQRRVIGSPLVLTYAIGGSSDMAGFLLVNWRLIVWPRGTLALFSPPLAKSFDCAAAPRDAQSRRVIRRQTEAGETDAAFRVLCAGHSRRRNGAAPGRG